MSTVTDKAELEAAIAEAELSDEEGELARASVAEGVPVAGAVALVLETRTGEDLEQPADGAAGESEGEPSDKQLRALDNEQRRHEGRVSQIMGSHVAGFVACEKCAGVGLVPPGPEPQTHPHFRGCETCRGFGLVLTGSLRENNTFRDCPGCAGRGYVEALGPGGVALSPAPAGGFALTAAGSNGEPPAPLAPDTAGAAPPSFGVPSWMGDPNVGQ